MNGSGRKDRTAQPLKGAVICCTSVPAEQRTLYADWALSMGADHKLDLTSDVTHLLVGDTDTPKYKYVAREREEVKVLRPEWIAAVRDAYMAADGVDLDDLEAKYKLPTFAGLTICITGFDDLHFRAQMQQKIDEEGGRYTGDLTKAVTHLIALKAEGKKYQYAMQWQKKIVTLNWLRDSLDRKMQLDETKYLHSIPFEDQGKGAWNRDAKYANHNSKRPRPQEPVAEPSRKLRRTASERFGSQNIDLWADINGKAGIERPSREPLRSSRSMPAFSVDEAPPDLATGSSEHDSNSRQPRIALISHGYMDGSHFVLDNFDARRASILRNILLGEGGTALDSFSDFHELDHVDRKKLFLVIPHNTRAPEPTNAARKSGQCQIVTELWIEKCMDRKQWVDPTNYPLGKPLHGGNGFQGLSINSSGFPGIERNHVAKVIQALGGTYDEVLRPGLTLLICYSSGSSVDKMVHAKAWGIAVVTANWLWASLASGISLPFSEYAIGSGNVQGDPQRGNKQVGPYANDLASLDGTVQLERADYRKPNSDEIPTQLLPKKVISEEAAVRERPGSDFVGGRAVSLADYRKNNPDKDHRNRLAPTNVRPGPEADRDLARDLPLQEATGNPPLKSCSVSPKNRKALFRTLDGASSNADTKQDDTGREGPNHVSRHNQDSQDPAILNGAIQELLNQRGRPKSSISSAPTGDSNKKPLSRALSNVSNASMGSRARASRAGSVSSVNTDGLGSEIAMESAEQGRAANSSRGRGNFKGRAKARDESQQPVQKLTSVELDDPGLYREDFVEEEMAPQLTQLGYEDPEEAIALRAKLAEKRRKKSRAGQEEPQPEEQPKEAARPERRIRDDDSMLDAKWAGGRRTRHRDKTPPGLNGLKDF